MRDTTPRSSLQRRRARTDERVKQYGIINFKSKSVLSLLERLERLSTSPVRISCGVEMHQ